MLSDLLLEHIYSGYHAAQQLCGLMHITGDFIQLQQILFTHTQASSAPAPSSVIFNLRIHITEKQKGHLGESTISINKKESEGITEPKTEFNFIYNHFKSFPWYGSYQIQTYKFSNRHLSLIKYLALNKVPTGSQAQSQEAYDLG